MAEIIVEPERETPVAGEADVVVCGGGPAGVAAAVTSARCGARTRLIELHGCLGGIWTAGLLSWIIDARGKGGVMAEILDGLSEMGARSARRPDTPDRDLCYDPEAMKLVLEDMCQRAGVDILLHSRVVAAVRGAERRLSHVITESKSGREAWAGRVFVDCTGDGDLAAQAGCGFDLGRPEDGACQPMSLICLVAGVRDADVDPFLGGRDAKQRLLAEMQRAGVIPSYGDPVLFRIRDGLYAMMANHEYGVSALDARRITEATLRSRAEVHGLVRALRWSGGPWSGLQLVATAEQIGVREGRRIHGRYTLSLDDLKRGARFDDAVCRVSFGIDVHAVDPAHGGAYTPDNRIKIQPYDVPLRSLIARDVDNLLMAGRCISGDFLAHASYRVTGNAVAMGEAAGRRAAATALGEAATQ